MTEYSTDLVMRMVEDIARLSAQALTARQFGLEEDVLAELTALDEQANKLDTGARDQVKALLDAFRRDFGPTPHQPGARLRRAPTGRLS